MGIRHRRCAIIVAVTLLLWGNTVAYASVNDFFRAALSGESATESIPGITPGSTPDNITPDITPESAPDNITPENTDNAADSEGSGDESIWGQWDAAKTSDKASDHTPSYSDPEEEELCRIREEQEKLLEEIPLEETEEKKPKEKDKKPEKAEEQEPAAEEKDNVVIDTIAVPEKTGIPIGLYVIIALLLAGAGGIGGYLLRHPARDEADDDTEL